MNTERVQAADKAKGEKTKLKRGRAPQRALVELPHVLLPREAVARHRPAQGAGRRVQPEKRGSQPQAGLRPQASKGTDRFRRLVPNQSWGRRNTSRAVRNRRQRPLTGPYIPEKKGCASNTAATPRHPSFFPATHIPFYSFASRSLLHASSSITFNLFPQTALSWTRLSPIPPSPP